MTAAVVVGECSGFTCASSRTFFGWGGGGGGGVVVVVVGGGGTTGAACNGGVGTTGFGVVGGGGGGGVVGGTTGTSCNVKVLCTSVPVDVRTVPPTTGLPTTVRDTEVRPSTLTRHV